jgi:hypothetical protein
VPDYRKTPLEIAAEIHKFDPQKLGDTHALVFELAEIAAATTGQPITIATPSDRLLLALSAQPNDGAAASYAGLELQFTYGDRDFATNGKTPQFVPFSMLAGRGPGPSQAGGPWYTWEVPIFLKRGTALVAKVKNRTAGALTPKVVLKTVELR